MVSSEVLESFPGLYSMCCFESQGCNARLKPTPKGSIWYIHRYQSYDIIAPLEAYVYTTKLHAALGTHELSQALTQRLHVTLWYIRGPQRGYHIICQWHCFSGSWAGFGAQKPGKGSSEMLLQHYREVAYGPSKYSSV